MTISNKKAMAKPFGLMYDVLHEIRKAKRALTRAEKWIMREHRMEKKLRALSPEWQESKRILAEERRHEAMLKEQS